MSVELTRDQLIQALKSKDIKVKALNYSRERIVFKGVAFNSKEIKGGELFIALKGTKHHGHQFAEEALARGASLVLVEDESFLNKNSPDSARYLYTPDTLKAFWALAQWWLKEVSVPVLAITGSVGKTTVKELCAALLLQKNVGCYSKASYNNYVGVPYTVLNLKKDHKWLVVELGMNKPEEIKNLSKLVSPTVGVITTVAPAHTETFNTVEDIAKEKLSITSGMKKGSPLVLNGDNSYIKNYIKNFKDTLEDYPLYFFGKEEGAHCRFLSFNTLGFEGIKGELEITLQGSKTVVPIESRLVGAHTYYNIACAVLSSLLIEPALSAEDIKTAVKNFVSPYMRMNVVKIAEDKIVVNDCYNANPASMEAALNVVKESVKEGKKVGAILGDMKELGKNSASYHQQISLMAKRSGLSFLIAVGDYAKDLVSAFKDKEEKSSKAEKHALAPCFIAESPVAAANIALKLEWDVLLIKGSRAVELENAFERILQEKQE
ncbi:MAG: UDP-N-acetylmuramoyl-tripeptide--D-alanyl-D-alanine ligase [Candidatus Dadabacteria bacterium]|nr:MAG: UDP-N-acetylmuramoyl-tripeptide--D-alanyl-D-alanine ligase [Candidatus Dadabacteria bacterium]